MKSQLQIPSLVIFFAASPCLLVLAQKITPGIYGDDEWQANREFEMDTRSFWLVVNNPKTINGQCTQEVSYGGQHILDMAQLECSTIPIVFADNYKVLVGNRMFSDTPGSVVFVTPDHKCIKKTYVMDRSSRLKIGQTGMTAVECANVRRKMKAALTEIGKEVIGETSPLMDKFLRKLGQEFADLGSNRPGDSGSTTNYIPQAASSLAVGGGNQSLQSNQVAQQLSQVADTLLNVVNQLAKTLGVDGKPDPILAGLGNTLSNIVGSFHRNGSVRINNVDY